MTAPIPATLYSIKCRECPRVEAYGYHRPALAVDRCNVARDMRLACKQGGCKFDLIEEAVTLDEIDQKRLGMLPDEPIA